MQSLFYVFIQQLCVRHSAVHTWIEGACVCHLPFPMHFCSLAHYDRTSLWEQLAADWLQFHFFLSCMLHCVIHEVQHTYWKNSFVKLEKKQSYITMNVSSCEEAQTFSKTYDSESVYRWPLYFFGGTGSLLFACVEDLWAPSQAELKGMLDYCRPFI